MIRLATLSFVVSWAIGCGAVAPQAENDAGAAPIADASDAADLSDAIDTPAADAAKPEVFGAACSTDADCALGLTCWNETFAGTIGGHSWPAHGMCTAVCTSDASCDARSKGSSCVGTSASSDTKLCRPACDPAEGTDLTRFDLGTDPAKCGGRADLACVPSGEHSYCEPTCNDQGACAPARCSATGFCTDKDVGDWADIGKAPGPGGSECSLHFIFGDAGDIGWCSARCTLGVVPSCGWAGPGVPAKAICLSGATSKIGDSGLCYEACDCDSDCRGKGVRCVPLDVENATSIGRKGYCGTYGPGTPACAP